MKHPEHTYGGFVPAISERGVTEQEPNNIFFQESDYVPKLKLWATSMLEGDENTFQQYKHDPNKITKPSEEEWDQSDFTNYAQHNHQMLLLKMSDGHVRPWTGFVRPC
jgi:hypothetical protein